MFICVLWPGWEKKYITLGWMTSLYFLSHCLLEICTALILENLWVSREDLSTLFLLHSSCAWNCGKQCLLKFSPHYLSLILRYRDEHASNAYKTDWQEATRTWKIVECSKDAGLERLTGMEVRWYQIVVAWKDHPEKTSQTVLKRFLAHFR